MEAVEAVEAVLQPRYLATSLLLADNNDMVRMIVNSVKTDMASGNEAEERMPFVLLEVVAIEAESEVIQI